MIFLGLLPDAFGRNLSHGRQSGHGCPSAYARPSPWLRIDGQFSVYEGKALAHALQSKAAGPSGIHDVWIEPDTVILDFQCEPICFTLQQNLSAAGARVVDHIVQGFTSNMKKRYFQIPWQALF